MKKRKYKGLAVLLASLLCLQGVLPMIQPKPVEVEAAAKEMAAKPYMGWSSFSQQVYDNANGKYWGSEELVKQQSDAMKEKLGQYGYEYINIDAGWNTNTGDEYGRPMINEQHYPGGFENLVDYVHNNGQKIGLYRIPGLDKDVWTGTIYTQNADNGGKWETVTYDGREDRPIYRSKEVFGREIRLSEILAKDEEGNPIPMDYWGYCWKIDYSKDGAELYMNSVVDKIASWGVDFLKFDSVMPGSFMGNSRDCIDEVRVYSEACERNNIWFELSWQLDRRYADVWKELANGWRIETDVEAYKSIADHGENAAMVEWEGIRRLFPTAARWWDVPGPGGWNDFDSLNVGNGEMNGITKDERKLATTFWAISAAQFYIGDDITKLDDYGLSLLTNEEVIAINQSGHPARPVDDSYEVWYANNGDGTYNVGVFNLSGEKKDVTVNWSDIGLAGDVEVRDVWEGRDLGTSEDSFTVPLNSHAAELYKVTTKSGTAIINDSDNYVAYEGDWSQNEGKEQVAANQSLTLNVIDSAQSGQSIITPGKAVFHKDVPQDVALQIKEGNVLQGVTDGSAALQEGADYTVEGDQVVISADYLGSKKGDILNLQFIFVGEGESIGQMVNDTDPSITYYKNVGGWGYSDNRNDAAYEPDYDIGRDVHQTTKAGDTAQLTFTGTEVSFITETDTINADFDAYIDGEFKGSFTTKVGDHRVCQVKYTFSDLEPGEHTIDIVTSSEGAWMHLDAFEVIPGEGQEPVIYNDTDPAILYMTFAQEEWNYSDNREEFQPTPDYERDVHYSETAGDYLTYDFTGSGVTFFTELMDQNADFDVYVDGVIQSGPLTTNNGGERECQAPSFSVSDLIYGEHTLKIVNTSGGMLHVDGFQVEQPSAVEEVTVYMVNTENYTTVDDTDRLIDYHGRWEYDNNRVGAYRSDIHIAKEGGESVTFTFSGTGVSYIGEKAPEVGKFEVLIDDVSQGIFDANTTGKRETQQVLYSISGLELGRHTIHIKKVDGQNIMLDTFRVEGPAKIQPDKFIYDKNAKAAGISFSLEGNKDYFQYLSRGTEVLSSPQDYTVDGDAVTISTQYLNNLADEEHIFDVKFQGDYNSDIHWTTENGAASSYTFTGTGVELLGPTGPEFGTMEVYIDDELKGSVNANSASRLTQQSLFKEEALEAGTHTIKMVKTGGSLMAFDAIALAVGGTGGEEPSEPSDEPTPDPSDEPTTDEPTPGPSDNNDGKKGTTNTPGRTPVRGTSVRTGDNTSMLYVWVLMGSVIALGSLVIVRKRIKGRK